LRQAASRPLRRTLAAIPEHSGSMATEHSITPSRSIRRSSKPERSSEPALPVRQVDATTELAAVANLGPKSARALVLAGVSSFAELSRLGSVRAYAKVKQQQPSSISALADRRQGTSYKSSFGVGAVSKWRLTPPSRGRSQAGFAHLRPPLTSNVRAQRRVLSGSQVARSQG
jgi:hypothetical protein